MDQQPTGAGGRRVLIVDRSAESREVLRTVLQRQGHAIFEASGGRQGLDLARQCAPDLIVLDLESIDAGESQVREGYGLQTRYQSAHLVLLGGSNHTAGAATGEQVFSKPYHYAPLIRRIEHLLQQSTKKDDLRGPLLDAS